MSANDEACIWRMMAAAFANHFSMYCGRNRSSFSSNGSLLSLIYPYDRVKAAARRASRNAYSRHPRVERRQPSASGREALLLLKAADNNLCVASAGTRSIEISSGPPYSALKHLQSCLAALLKNMEAPVVLISKSFSACVSEAGAHGENAVARDIAQH